MLFSGDHVMAWSTPVVAPPDGSMGDYMASLEKLRAAQRADLFPGPRRRVSATRRASSRAYILHRKAREASILNRLGKGRERHPGAGAGDLRQPRSAADAARRACRCWRIWRTWWRAAPSRPTARPRSPAATASRSDAFCGWRPSAGGFFCRCSRSCWLGARADLVVDVLQQAADARGVGAEVVLAVARRRAHVDHARRRSSVRMRTATSSRKPMIGVRATASIWPSRRPACGGRSTTTRHLRLVMTRAWRRRPTCGVA